MRSDRPRAHYRLTLAVLSMAAIAYALLQSLVVPALPDFQRAFGASQSDVSWLLTAFLLSSSVITPIAGRLGDMYGKNRALVVLLSLLVAGTFISAIATSLNVMIAGRVIQGAAGGIFPLGFGIIRDEFPPHEVPGGIGFMSSLIGVGGAAGLPLAGVVVENLNYHWLYWIPMVVGVATLIAAYRFIPESPVKVPGRINWPAAALLSVGLTAVLVAVSQSNKWGWGSAKTLGLLLAGGLVLAAWITVELRSSEPLIDMRMMRLRGVWTTNLVAFLVGVGMYSSFILLPELVQEPVSTGYGFGSTVLEAGLFLAPSAIAMLFVGQVAGKIERRFGSKLALMAGIVATGLAFLVLVSARSEKWEIYFASALIGIGIGLAFASMGNLIVQSVTREQTGAATGMNTVMRTLGGALGGQLVATMLANSVAGDGLPSANGYSLAFGLCTAALVVALAACTLIPRPRRAGRPPAPVTRGAEPALTKGVA